MGLDNIEKLLEKYDNGETSLKEEQQLRAYFAQDEIAPHLATYKVMFQYFANTQQEQYTKDVPLQKQKRSYVYQWISVAAIIVIMFGIFSQFNGDQKRTLEDLSHDELIAYNNTKDALNLISSKFNKGSTSVFALNLAANQLEKGTQQVNQIEEFSKATNRIFKNN